MRVIAGTAGGRRLAVPPGRAVRPTSERVREALFSALGPTVPGARVLDLYAGSGALGIEALSRGAALAVMVEREPRMADLIRRNLRAVGLEGGVVRAMDAARYCRAAADGPFDLVVADPPYDTPLPAVLRLLSALHDGGALAGGATVVVERRSGADGLPSALPEPAGGVAWSRVRAYGDTVLLWGRAEEVER